MQTVCNMYWDAGKGNLTAQNTRKPLGGRGSAADPTERAYSALANPLVGGEGLAVLSPKTPSPALGPSGLASSTPTPKLVPTPLLAKWLARKTPLRKPNCGEGIISTKPRPRSVYDFLGLLFHCSFCVQLYACVVSLACMIYIVLLWQDVACLCWNWR